MAMETTLELPTGLGAALPCPDDERRRKRAFWSTMACFLVHGLVVSTWVSRIASVKTALALGDGALGLALLGTAIGSVTAIPICGSLVTRFGSRRMAQWTAAGFCLSLVAIAFARDGQHAVRGALVVWRDGGRERRRDERARGGDGEAAGDTDDFAISFDVQHRRDCGRGSGSGDRGTRCAGAGAPGGRGGGDSGVHAGGDAAAGGDAEWRDAHAARASFRRVPGVLIALSAIGFCIFLSEGAIADWTAVYLKQILGAGEGLAPVGYAVFSAAMAVFRLTGDAITLRLGRARVIRYGGSAGGRGTHVRAAGAFAVLGDGGVRGGGRGILLDHPVGLRGGRADSGSRARARGWRR